MKIELKAKDLINNEEAVPDAKPVFHDEEYARKCGFNVVRIKPDVQFEELMISKKGFPNSFFSKSIILTGVGSTPLRIAR